MNRVKKAYPDWIYSLLLPSLTTLIGIVAKPWTSSITLLLLYLMGVLYCSMKSNWRTVFLCAGVSFLQFNYFHTTPRYTFLMHDLSELIAAVAFFVFALLAGRMSNRIQKQMITLKSQEKQLVQKVSQLDQALKARNVAERKAEEESLRNALLSSVSHDLKSPLVTMLGSATSLRDLHQDLSEEDQFELLDSIISESERLERYIQNLLDMTRLGHGELPLNRQWISVEELYYAVKRRLDKTNPNHGTILTSGVNASLFVHPALIEQALFNAVENAIKASPEPGSVHVQAYELDKWIVIDVMDQGPGIPQSEWEAVFDSFYTFSQGDHYTNGSGLGLTIVRGMCRVHGGDAVIVEPPEGCRHCLRMSLPVSEQVSDKQSTYDDQ